MTSPNDGPSKRVATVLNGFTELTTPEQNEFIRLLNMYTQSGGAQRTTLRKSFGANRVNLGPTGSSCPCCGR